MKAKVLLFMDACNAGTASRADRERADMTGFANDASREFERRSDVRLIDRPAVIL